MQFDTSIKKSYKIITQPVFFIPVKRELKSEPLVFIHNAGSWEIAYMYMF